VRLKLCLVIFSLDKGGAEKIFAFLANQLDLDNFEIFLITISSNSGEGFEIRPSVSQICLGHKRVLSAFFSLPQTLKKINPDIVLSTIVPVNILVGLLLKFSILPKASYLLRESSIPSMNIKLSGRFSFFLSFLTRWVYNSFDQLIAQCTDMRNDMINHFGVKPEKISIINNPIETVNKFDISFIESSKRSDRKILINVGNLRQEKGQDRLIDIAYYLKDDLNFELWIIGNGIMREMLEQKINALGLNDHIKMFGHCTEVDNLLIKADLFIQTSYYEGFPNALLEAISVGLPFVAFDVPGGTKDIAENEINGFLVKDGDISEFCKTVKFALSHPFDIKNMIASVNKKYNPDFILHQYQNKLLSVSQQLKNR